MAKKQQNSTLMFAKEAVKLLIERKALDIKMYDVSEKSPMTDYYINATGRASTHVMSLADEVDDKLCRLGKSLLHMEGKSGGAWLLCDFGDIIVNIFDKPSREFYDLDRLFSPDSLVDIQDCYDEIDKKYGNNN